MDYPIDHDDGKYELFCFIVAVVLVGALTGGGYLVYKTMEKNNNQEKPKTGQIQKGNNYMKTCDSYMKTY